MRNRYTNFGWLVTVIVGIIPALLWFTATQMQWGSASQIFDNISRLAGLSGMALFAWNVILSARLKIYNKLFMGLDNTYRAHHVIGSVAFILLLIHPLAVTMSYFLVSPLSAYEFLLPNLSKPFLIIGWITVFCMAFLMLVTLFIKVKYELFVMAQRLLGLLLFVGSLHAVFIGSNDLGINGGLVNLQAYIFVLIILAGVVYGYRSIYHGNFSKYYDYVLDDVISVGDVYEIRLSPSGNPMPYLPGQFAFIKIQATGVLGQTHPFSISSDTNVPQLSFGIKSLGDYTKLLANAKKGIKIKIDGPYGTFSNKIVANHRQIWVASGIGITPFLAMAKSLGGEQNVDLYYSTKTTQEAVYLPFLINLANRKINLKIIPFNTSTQGFLTADYIFNKSHQLSNANFMICGSPGMMASLKLQLKNKGVIRKNINTEEFNLT